jgi:hypothetical protein
VAELDFEDAAIFDTYETNRETGAFILIDPESLNTVAGGMIDKKRSKSGERLGHPARRRSSHDHPARAAGGGVPEDRFRPRRMPAEIRVIGARGGSRRSVDEVSDVGFFCFLRRTPRHLAKVSTDLSLRTVLTDPGSPNDQSTWQLSIRNIIELLGARPISPRRLPSISIGAAHIVSGKRRWLDGTQLRLDHRPLGPFHAGANPDQPVDGVARATIWLAARPADNM